MAVLYGRIFVAIRRRSKLEIWQNAVVVAGGSRATRTDNTATSRKLLDSKHDDDGEESDAEAVSCSSRSRDDARRVVRLIGHEAASRQQSTVVVDHVRSQNSPDRRLDARRLHHLDDAGAAPAAASTSDDPQRQSSSPRRHADGRRKCVRFLLVGGQRESDSNDVDDELDQIEMWSDRPPPDDDCASDDERSLPARLMRRLRRHRVPKDRGAGERQRQSSLSSDVKAAKQLGVIMGAFCICFLPYFVCFVVVAVCRQCVGDRLMTTVTWIGYVNSTLNPFLYPLCNHQFRITFRRMFANVLNLGSTQRGTVAT